MTYLYPHISLLQCLTQFLDALSGASYTTDELTVFAAASSAFSSCVGSDYLKASFGYSHTHLWRNVSIVVVFTALYIIPTIIAPELLPFAGGGGGSTVFAPTKNAKRAARQSETLTKFQASV